MKEQLSKKKNVGCHIYVQQAQNLIRPPPLVCSITFHQNRKHQNRNITSPENSFQPKSITLKTFQSQTIENPLTMFSFSRFQDFLVPNHQLP